MARPADGGFWRRFGLVLAGVLVALAAGEAAVRTWVPVLRPREGRPEVVPTGGAPVYWLKPSHSYEYRWDGDPYGTLPPGARMRVVVGPDGYRGERAAGRADVVVVGDSFTFGEGVEVGERFSDLVQAGLAGPDGRGPVVLNVAAPGWSLLDEAAMVRAVVPRHGPRLVLVVLQPNDLVSLAEAQRHAGGDLLVHAADPSARSRLVDLARSRLASRRTEDWYLSYWNGAERVRWQAARGLVGEMQQRAAAGGARLAIAVFPLLHRLDDYPFAPAHQLVLAACREDGVPALDLHGAFRGLDAESLWVHPTDHHPNARAHRIAADALLPFVRELLQRP